MKIRLNNLWIWFAVAFVAGVALWLGDHLSADWISFIATGCIGGSSKSATDDITLTASGQGTNISRGGTSAQTGAIAVGEKGQYREAGSIDLSGFRNTGTGSTTVNIVPQAALDTLKSLADKFSNTVQGIAGNGSTTVLSGPASAGINYKKLIIGGILGIAAFFGLRALLGRNKP
jgi:hypothetical protein